MKKLPSTIMAMVLLSLFIGTPVFAADPVTTATVTPTITPTVAKYLTRKDEKRESNEERRELKVKVNESKKEVLAQRKQTLDQVKRTKLQTSFTHIKNQLNAELNYLNSMKARIATRISQKKAAGKDMSAAEAKLNSFDTTVFTADMTALDSQINQLMTAEKPVSLMPQLRQAVSKVRTDLHNLRQVLVASLRLTVKQ